MENSVISADKSSSMTAISEISDLFSRIPLALYRTDLDGNLLTANPALVTLLGYSTFEEVVEAHESVRAVYVNPTDRDRWLAEMSARGLVFDFDLELRRADGSTIWVQDTSRAIKNESGEIIYYEGALIDVSEKVEAMKARDEFVATVSHELRNPIAVVLGMSEELASGYETFEDGDRREMAEMIARQAEDASWLIEDLLVAYRDDVGEVAIAAEEFDLLESMRRVLEVVERHIDLDTAGHDESKALADPRRTRQIIRNLVNNALHHGGEDIKVRVTGVGDMVEAVVCDSGDEITADEVSEIFQAFKRGTRSMHPSSVGLGLPVARRLARLMGGDLTYRYEAGYSCFTLSLPAA